MILIALTGTRLNVFVSQDRRQSGSASRSGTGIRIDDSSLEDVGLGVGFMSVVLGVQVCLGVRVWCCWDQRLLGVASGSGLLSGFVVVRINLWVCYVGRSWRRGLDRRWGLASGLTLGFGSESGFGIFRDTLVLMVVFYCVCLPEGTVDRQRD